MIGLFIADEGSQDPDYRFIFMKPEFPHTLIYHIRAYVGISLDSEAYTPEESAANHAAADTKFVPKKVFRYRH